MRISECRSDVCSSDLVFGQHLHSERQARDVAQLCCSRVERIICVSLAADVQRRAGSKRVVARGRHMIAVPMLARRGNDCPKAKRESGANGSRTRGFMLAPPYAQVTEMQGGGGSWAIW